MVCASGQEPNDQVVDQMMSEAPGPLNFTMFLTLFGEKLTGNACMCPFMCTGVDIIFPVYAHMRIPKFNEAVHS